jgi:site-specific recombinase XerD
MSERERNERKPGDRGLFERPKKGSGVWWIRYHDENGCEHREKVGPKGLARKVYQKRKTEIQERKFFPERIRQRDRLLAEVIDDYLVRIRHTHRSYRDSERYGRYWNAVFPGKTLRQLQPGDIERYVAQRLQEAAPASVNRELAFLKRIFNVAIADGYDDANPVQRVKLQKENNARTRFLTDEEEERLQVALRPEHWIAVEFALHTGLRQSEQFGLRWENVDFRNGTIKIARSKNGEMRHVAMNATVRSLLRGLPSRFRSAYVFPSSTLQSPQNARNFARRVFVPALRRAGIKDFRWHDLRHTFASRLVMAGVDLRTVQELMGHKTMAMTLRYSHLSPEHQLHAVEHLNRDRTGINTGTSEAEVVTGHAAGTEVLELMKENGGPCRDRTYDPLIKSQLLYQLS